MDDPWGSPWADESPLPLPQLDKLVSKRPVTPEKVSSADQDSKSPWDSNDGFGEWATLPATDEILANDEGGPEQAEIVEGNVSFNKQFTQGNNHVRPDGSTWFSRQIKPATKENVGLEIPQLASRSLSPDPWAQESAGAEEEAEPRHDPKSSASEESRTNDTTEDGTHNGLVTVQNGNEYGTKSTDELDIAARRQGDEESPVGRLPIKCHQDEPTANVDDTAADIQTRDVVHGEPLTSRPSSSPSDHSHRDEVLTESPRTSFEEDDKRPRLEKQSSSKVKEMICLFDGLPSDDDSIVLRGHVHASDDRFDTPIAAQSEDDFGDFEEDMSCITTKTDREEDISIKAKQKTRDTVIMHMTSDIPATAEEPLISPSDQRPEPCTPVEFKPELSLLRQIFEQTPDSEHLHADPKQAPDFDAVMEDTFSSTNERKMWYRISRFGTMRKHNAGEEDSFVRINWKDSTVRIETLKVVGRWIEEDHLGGGVAIGGGTRVGSMFGWGQKNAAPMSVAAALASRNEKISVHSGYNASQTSTRKSDASPTRMSSSSRKSSEQITVTRNSLQSPASTTAPQFSWSTGTPVSATVEAMLSVLSPMTSPKGNLQISSTTSSHPKSVRESISTSHSGSPRSFAAQHAKPADNVPELMKYPVLQKAPKYPTKRPSLEADNDWSEMISSPALENPLDLKAALQEHTKLGAVEVSSMDFDRSSEKHSNDQITASHSDSGAFVVPSITDHAFTSGRASSITPESDAWTTADFSFFDSSTPSQTTSAHSAPIPKAFIPKILPITTSQGSSREQMEQAEQDTIVKNIVQYLPDLSYMLRK